MKKLMAILLAAIMVMTIVIIPVSAAETDDGLYVAPVFYGTQKRTNNNGTIDVRFVSVANSLAGAKLGYEITASWWDATAKDYKTTVYSAANGHDALETNVIYASVEAGEETVTATDLGTKLGMTDARGIMAVAINGVPAGIEVLFSVKTYVKDAEGAVVATTESKEVIYANGERSADKVLYYNNFNDAEINVAYANDATGGDMAGGKAAIVNALGWDGTGCNLWDTRILNIKNTTDGKINVSSEQGIFGITVLPAGAINNASNFTAEMDVTVNGLGLIDFALGSTYAARNAAAVQFRGFVGTTMQGTGALSNTDTTVGIQGYNCGGVAVTDLAYAQELHLTIDVNLLENKIVIYVDGAKIHEGTYGGSLDGGFAILLSAADFTLDNMVVTSTPYVKTEKVLYSNDFNAANINVHYANDNTGGDEAGGKAAIVEQLGWNGAGCNLWDTRILNIKNTTDGKININTEQGIFGVAILPAGAISSNADSFKVEMDIAINGLGLVDFALGSTYSARNTASVQFRAYSDANRTAMLGTGAMDTSNTYVGVQGYSCGGQSGSNLGLEGNGYGQEFHLTFEVDVQSKTVTIYADGTQVFQGTYSGSLDGGLCVLLSSADITIDNLKVTTVA